MGSGKGGMGRSDKVGIGEWLGEDGRGKGRMGSG